MFASVSTMEILARAIDVCALKQAVYSANIANANVDGYRRLEVQFDAEAMRNEAVGMTPRSASDAGSPSKAEVVATSSSVKLDEEMAALARNALRYQTLLSAYERSASLLKMAVHEGKE